MMTKTIFATICLALILSTAVLAQPARLHNRTRPSGIVTEIGMPAADVKANSTKSNKVGKGGNTWICKWEGPDLDAHSNPMVRGKGKTIKH